MKVLVTVASRHGSTAAIACAIADGLKHDGFEVDLQAPEQVTCVDGYDAVVLGSAVYMSHWLPEACDFAERFIAQLAKLPVWLFSSGPVGDPPKPATVAADVAPAMACTGARDHQVFGGRIAREELSLGERAIVTVMHIKDRDDRDWDQIAGWTREIAKELQQAD